VEGEGIRRAADQRRSAAVVLYVLDATRPGEGAPQPGDVVVINKQDLAGVPAAPGHDGPTWPVSALDGHGLDALRAHLGALVGPKAGPGMTLWTSRQGEAAERSSAHLQAAADQLTAAEHGPAAFEIGEALRALDDLLGIDPTEAVLDELFARFCVGK